MKKFRKPERSTGLDLCPQFEIPNDVYQSWDAKDKGISLESDWDNLFAKYAEQYPEDAQEFKRRIQGDLPDAWDQKLTSALEQLVKDMPKVGDSESITNGIGSDL